jgi:hypothetical protein
MKISPAFGCNVLFNTEQEHLVCLCLRTKKINLSFGDLTKTKQNFKMKGSS